MPAIQVQQMPADDEILHKITDQNVWPNLEHFRLYGAADMATNGLIRILKNCPKKLRYIVISARDVTFISTLAPSQLMRSPSEDLKQLDLQNFLINNGVKSLITDTEKIPGLEFVYGGVEGRHMSLYRNVQSMW